MRTVLAIETSCDETAVAVIEKNSETWKIRAEQILSQSSVHSLYGGVVPELAAREHLRALPLLMNEVLEMAHTTLAAVDGIAVTAGPGLKGCLLMGISFAKGVALAMNIPLLGVNHIEGHVLSPLLDNPELTFPYLALVVSGGHTEIHVVKNYAHYELIARTTDDAAGEAFDKSANLLGFEYPGGPRLAALADTRHSSRFVLPRVMRDSAGFSFSGLKTAISLLIRKEQDALQDEDARAELAFAVQESIVDALVFKVRGAAEALGVTNIAICGGVAANKRLREKLGALEKTTLFCPTFSHCMDNAAMIAFAGAPRLERGERDALSVGPLPRWPLEGMNNHVV